MDKHIRAYINDLRSYAGMGITWNRWITLCTETSHPLIEHDFLSIQLRDMKLMITTLSPI